MKKQCKNNFYGTLVGMLPHAILILSLLLLTLFVTDRFNRAMAFLNNSISYVLIWVYAVLCIWQMIEVFFGRFPPSFTLFTAFPACPSALAILIGRGLDEMFRRRGFYNRESSKWVLFGVCILMCVHAVWMICLQRKRLWRSLSMENIPTEYKNKPSMS